MSSQYLEDTLSGSTSDIHRALASLQEELEAVDYYQQRGERTEDPQLRELLSHNRKEEIEHAAMLFEWLRRNAPDFDEIMKQYLFTEQDLTDLEHADKADDTSAATGDLGLGNLK